MFWHFKIFTAGYWNNPAATQASFMPGGWFRTGDLATIGSSGYMSVVDRKKDMVGNHRDGSGVVNEMHTVNSPFSTPDHL